jgi:hypothetical protein
MRANCFNCKYAFLSSDESVGIPLHLEECKNRKVPAALFDELDANKDIPEDIQTAFQEDTSFTNEDFLALRCGEWEPRIKEAKCSCGKTFKYAEGLWNHFDLDEKPVCSKECDWLGI